MPMAASVVQIRVKSTDTVTIPPIPPFSNINSPERKKKNAPNARRRRCKKRNVNIKSSVRFSMP